MYRKQKGKEMENLKEKLLNEDSIDMSTQDDEIIVWFSNVSKNFCIMLNSACIHSSKTFLSFSKALNRIL